MATGDTIRSYKDLDVWVVAMALAERCYRATRDFPREEIYRMTAQIRRSSASVPANIPTDTHDLTTSRPSIPDHLHLPGSLEMIELCRSHVAEPHGQHAQQHRRSDIGACVQDLTVA